VRHASDRKKLVIALGVLLVLAAAAAVALRTAHDVEDPPTPGHAQPPPEPSSSRVAGGGERPSLPEGLVAPSGMAVIPTQGGSTTTAIEVVVKARAEGEWQGMPQRLMFETRCTVNMRCGSGLACVEGSCTPCERDADCGAGRACVLDYCLPAANVRCRSARECDGRYCVLDRDPALPRTDYTSDLVALCEQDLQERSPEDEPSYELDDASRRLLEELRAPLPQVPDGDELIESLRH
jgi:hypothetical protein